MVLKLVMVLVTMAASSLSFGLSYQKAYQLIAERGEALNYSNSNHGALCEILAVEKMREVFPDAEITSGITYAPKGGAVKGELDVVVMEGGEAVMVIEVKCMKGFTSAARKAESQLRRFESVAGRCDYKYWQGSERYDCSNFDEKPSYHKMSYDDAKSSGFDLSFDLTRKQILQLISELRRK